METFWRKVDVGNGQAPSQRRYHSSAVFRVSDTKIQMLVFGGLGPNRTQSAFNDLWTLTGTLDTSTTTENGTNPVIYEFECLASTSPLQGRFGHSACAYGEYMIVFGGATRDLQPIDDLWLYHHPTRQWTQIPKPSHADEEWPSGRYHHSALLVDHRLLILGGMSGKKSYEGTAWQFNLNMRKWTRVLMNKPAIAQRAGHLLIHDPTPTASSTAGKKLYLYGGYQGDGGFEYQSDAYSMILSEDDLEVQVVDMQGTKPFTTRSIAICAHTGPSGSSVWSFGGYDGQTPTAELVTMKFQSDATQSQAVLRWVPVQLWMEMDAASILKSAQNNAATKPTPRYGHVAEIFDFGMGHDGKTPKVVMVVFGGSGSMFLNDVVEIEVPLDY